MVMITEKKEKESIKNSMLNILTYYIKDLDKTFIKKVDTTENQFKIIHNEFFETISFKI